MERAFPIFKKAGLNVEPVFAENILVLDADAKARQTQDDIRCGDSPIDAMSIDEICEYYKTPKGGKQYDVKLIRQLLTQGKSLEEMLFPWWYVRVVDDSVCADGAWEDLAKYTKRCAQARDQREAARKLRCDEEYVKGPFENLEQAHKG